MTPTVPLARLISVEEKLEKAKSDLEASQQREKNLETRITGAEVERDHFRVALDNCQTRAIELETKEMLRFNAKAREKKLLDALENPTTEMIEALIGPFLREVAKPNPATTWEDTAREAITVFARSVLARYRETEG